MNKIITISALSFTLLIHNAYGMEQGQTASPRGQLSLSRSSGEGSSMPFVLDKIALLRSTPLTQVQVINFDPDTTLTDGKKQFLVSSLLSIDDAVTLRDGRVILDASKTYVFPPTTSEDESSEESRPSDALGTLLQLMESDYDETDMITVVADGKPTEDRSFERAISIIDMVIQAVSQDDQGKVTIDVNKLPGYQEEEEEEEEELETEVVDKLTALKQARLSNIDLVGLESLSTEEQQAIQAQKEKLSKAYDLLETH